MCKINRLDRLIFNDVSEKIREATMSHLKLTEEPEIISKELKTRDKEIYAEVKILVQKDSETIFETYDIPLG